MDDTFSSVTRRLWALTGPDAPGPADPFDALTLTGPRVVLGAAYDVTGLATGAVAAATLAAAELLAARRGDEPGAVTVDSVGASTAFAGEALYETVGFERPPLWDPIAGNYRAADGWVRLHTNYAHHRAAVERVLDARDRDTVAAAVSRLGADEVETAVVAAGGAAAAMHTRAAWLASAPGAATAETPPVRVSAARTGTGELPARLAHAGAAPLAGVRVLDLTRVIAGPVATRFLAAHGADVLRIDPPGFDEVASLLPETTRGKRTAGLDLRDPADRASFERLLADADVLVCGLRADALERLGYDDAALAAVNPDLTVATLDAYGWEGPWRDRRGFDSLVQMSCGIAAAGAEMAGTDTPTPLPVQALDHATGWLLAAAVTRALTRRLTDGHISRVHAALVGTANLLVGLARPDAEPVGITPGDVALVEASSAWGPVRYVPLPGQVAGVTPHLSPEAGPLGRDAAVWA